MKLLLLYSSLLLLLLLLLSSQGLASTTQGRACQDLLTVYTTPHRLIFLTFSDVSCCHRFLAGRGPLHYQLKEPAPKVVEGAEAMSAARIGSRPPRCEGRCALCGRCEAVQVPVAPRDKGGSHFRLSGALGGGDDDEGSTNYKPLNWKCRCADRRPILNP
ncbi:hypothetical protein ACQJBY_031554 [Aegilops geniculata]